MSVTLKVDTSVAEAKQKYMRQKIDEMLHAMGSMSARVAAFHCQEYTYPIATASNDWPFHKMEARINRDVHSTFWNTNDKGWEFAAYNILFHQKSEKAAKSWWGEYQQQKRDGKIHNGKSYQERFEKTRGINRRINEYEYLKYKKDNNEKLPGMKSSKHRVLGFVNDARRRGFIKERQKTKGLAKAGWFACERNLRGTRGGLMVTTSKHEAGKRRFPKEINTPYNYFTGPALGDTTIMVNPQKGYHATLTNHVSHADENFPDFGRDKVTELVLKYIHLDVQRKFIHNKKGTFWPRFRMPKAKAS